MVQIGNFVVQRERGVQGKPDSDKNAVFKGKDVPPHGKKDESSAGSQTTDVRCNLKRETAGVAGRLWDSVGASTTPVRAARRCSLRRGAQSSLDAAVDVEKVEGRGKKLGGSAEWPSQSGSIASDLGIAKPAVSNPSLNSKKKIKDGCCRMYNVLL